MVLPGAGIANEWNYGDFVKIIPERRTITLMAATFKQTVTVQSGGIIEIRSSELHAGDEAEVIVVVKPPPAARTSETRKGDWRRFAGIFDSGDPHSGDNDRIDADLAEEYGNGLNPES